ncbi:hypothetical protein N9W89_03955 [Hellea sp.]|nr:hypothetical protein [Hellea sp.]
MSSEVENDFIKLHDLIEVDFEFYQATYPDLSTFTEEQLYDHYSLHGYWEGRAGSKYCSRAELIKIVPEKALELGPFNSPLIGGDDVKYFDVLSKTKLIKRAEDIGISIDEIPHIDYVSKHGDLGIVEEKFDAVISSHNIEHQTDLISHFRSVAEILNDTGKYFLIVPHSKFCFDAALGNTKVSDIFNAFYEKRKLHTVGSVIEHIALTVHNDPQKHWEAAQREEDRTKVRKLNSKKISSALHTYDAHGKTYIDVHAWQFTPISFSNILNCLIEMGIVPFSKVRVFGQVLGSNEFTAIIEK